MERGVWSRTSIRRIAPWRKGCDEDGQKEEGHRPNGKHGCGCEPDRAHELGDNMVLALEAQLLANSRL